MEEDTRPRTKITLHNKSIMESLEEGECLHQIEGEGDLHLEDLCDRLQQMGFVAVMINVVVEDEEDTEHQWDEEVDLLHWNDLPLLIQAVSLAFYSP